MLQFFFSFIFLWFIIFSFIDAVYIYLLFIYKYLTDSNFDYLCWLNCAHLLYNFSLIAVLINICDCVNIFFLFLSQICCIWILIEVITQFQEIKFSCFPDYLNPSLLMFELLKQCCLFIFCQLFLLAFFNNKHIIKYFNFFFNFLY